MASFNENLARLRKEAGLTQEALAQAVNVSPQAVSKWESSGMPDTALLPAIADALNTSIDHLFGRNPAAGDVEQAIGRDIGRLPHGERLSRAMALRWALQRAFMCGTGGIRTEDNIDAYQGAKYSYSQVTRDDGLSLVGLSQRLNYAFLAQDGSGRGFAEQLGGSEQYAELFALLANAEARKLIFFLHARDDNPFTAAFIEKQTGIPAARVQELVPQLDRMKLVIVQSLLLDDKRIEVYRAWANPALIPMLMFAQEIIDRPHWFCYQTNDRTKPLFAEA